MTVRQTFESTISDIHNTYSVACLTVPARSFPDRSREERAEALPRRLGLELAREVPPSFLPHAIACLVASSKGGEDPLTIYYQLMENPSERPITERLGTEMFQFAEEVSFSYLIPFEYSPIELTPLATLFASANAVGLGAYAGWVIADSTPLLFLMVPAGMLLFGATAGIALGLQDSLKKRVHQWLAGNMENGNDDTTSSIPT